MTDRTQVMQRVLNLRELASNNASEAEAMSAMKLAEKMMANYRIEEAELALAEGLGEIKVDIVDETCDRGFLNQGSNRHKIQSCIWAIEKFCEVEATLRTGVGTYRVIGDKPDVELFHWMTAMIKDALDRSYDAWKRTQQSVGRGAKPSFQLSMSARICERLREMTAERTAERKQAETDAAKLLNVAPEDIRVAVSNGDLQQLNNSTSLVVVAAAEAKRKAVTEAYKAAYAGVRLGTSSGFGYRSGTTAAAAGRSAGSSLGLNRPVGGAARRGLLN